ncbi:hypothetical protein AVEN_179593-1 [Araneus ventricosus]|uniref:Uncharacterized protein n=1 Tax=Araneus ventricosus TaxID=182803 RepID=A0A4Y2BET6_ARAVE|nr:hypothetical protein AVEN_179593-1 [Araneus ventricosus]
MLRCRNGKAILGTLLFIDWSLRLLSTGIRHKLSTMLEFTLRVLHSSIESAAILKGYVAFSKVLQKQNLKVKLYPDPLQKVRSDGSCYTENIVYHGVLAN